MDFNTQQIKLTNKISIENKLPKIGKEEITSIIITGLCSEKKCISSMFFYDAVGSKLFEDITKLPEYYPTRIEKNLIKQLAASIGPFLKDVDIVELGSGDCSKISVLFSEVLANNLGSIRYIPVDVSISAIKRSAESLSRVFPDIEVNGLVSDFLNDIELDISSRKRLFCFFGSTVGNLEKEQSEKFFKYLGSVIRSGEQFILGIDMIKEKLVLEKAYNDDKQVTSQFNKNILNVVNDLIKTNFDTQKFKHQAFYNDQKERIEMHLQATEDMTVESSYLPEPVQIKKGETIHTENSHKFNIADIENFSRIAGLKIVKTYLDQNGWFSLVHFQKS